MRCTITYTIRMPKPDSNNLNLVHLFAYMIVHFTTINTFVIRHWCLLKPFIMRNITSEQIKKEATFLN